jgi:quercetin dioxygenase-like cupin family protein
MKVAVVLLLGALIAVAQQASTPVENEPNHKTVLQNDYIRAYRITLEPGKSTEMHTHSHDDIAVRLADSRITQDQPGKPTGPTVDERVGRVSARSITGHPFTHRINNIGTTNFDVVDVEVLKRPPGAETKTVSEVAAENPSQRVYRWELKPGESSAEHTHQRPYLIIAATNMKLTMSSPDGKTMTHQITAGDVHWVDSRVMHQLGNAGSEPGILVEVELK